MAETRPEARPPAKRKGFDIAHPGMREYLIAGGVALAAGLLYFWWKNKQAAASTAAANQAASTGSGTAPAATSSPTGLSSAQLLAWLSDHQSSPGSTTTTSTSTSTGTGTGTTTTATMVKVPNVVGMWVARPGGAEDTLKAAGFTYRNSQVINPKYCYKVNSQTPGAGKSAPKGSNVDLGIGKVNCS